MRNILFFIICVLICFTDACSQTSPREKLFTDGWRFLKDSTIDASDVLYDDDGWRALDLPHDWSIEDLPNQKPNELVGPFDRQSIGQGATGFTVGGTGWYRKKFKSSRLL